MYIKGKRGANARQHGGGHYKGHEYEHWDWVHDIGLPYLLGCATKYVSRWREKNGKEDLLKAMHYLDKAEERGIETRPGWRGAETNRFIQQHALAEAETLLRTVECDYDMARDDIRRLLRAAD